MSGSGVIAPSPFNISSLGIYVNLTAGHAGLNSSDNDRYTHVNENWF